MSAAALVDRQVEAYNAGDIDAFVACYADDVVIRHGDGRTLMNGRDQVRSSYAEWFASQPNLHAEVVNRIQLGEWVVDEERVTSTDREMHAVVAYRVVNQAIETVVMLTPDG